MFNFVKKILEERKERKKKEKEEESKSFIDKVQDSINNMTDEQYLNERKFHTTFEEELANFAQILAERKANGDIKPTSADWTDDEDDENNNL